MKELRNGITNLHNSMKLINNKIYSILTDEQLFEYHKWLDLHKEELNNCILFIEIIVFFIRSIHEFFKFFKFKINSLFL